MWVLEIMDSYGQFGTRLKSARPNFEKKICDFDKKNYFSANFI